MSFLKKLFGVHKRSEATPAATPAPSPNPAEDPNMIRVFDAYGRELFITRQQWRDNVLIGNIEKHWNNADMLAGFIIQSLQDQFFEEMVNPSERLVQLEPESERSAVLLAIVYLKVKRVDDSEQVLQRYISRHGESGVILTNLAKVHAERGHDTQALNILWRSMQLDPNQDNGLGWYEVIHREKGGEQAGLEALRRIAEIPGSWRAQLWLARHALRSSDLDRAMTLYRECLERAGQPSPTDLLMQMSGDLGNAGYLAEILQLVEPRFEPPVHGLQVGNNLIKAYLDLCQPSDARIILDQLYTLQRPDWNATLSYWDTEIAKAKIANAQIDDQGQMNASLLAIDGPVWLKPDSPAAELFPVRVTTQPVIAFLGSTAEIDNSPSHVHQQLADPPGRLSRALPLFLAEQVEFRCLTHTQILVPWLAAPAGGFILSGTPWSDQDAANYARQCEVKSAYIVISHLAAQAEPWGIELRLVRTSDGQCVGHITESFPMAEPSQSIKNAVHRLLEVLTREATLPLKPVPKEYSLPDSAHFPVYLLRLEQLLAVRCAGLENVQAGFLNGEREIIDGNIQQCLIYPASVNMRVLLAQTLLAMRHVRPEIVREFKERVDLLQKEHPLPEFSHKIVQRIIDEAVIV